MKIAYISNSFMPSQSANSIHVMKMCQAIDRNNHNVILYIQNRIKDYKDIFAYYGINSSFEIKRVPWYKIKGRNIIYGMLAAFKSKHQGVDLALSRNIAGAFFAALFGVPVIFETHSPIRDKGRLSEWIFKKLLKNKNLKKIIVITNSLKEYYIDKYCIDPNIFKVCPDSADPLEKNIKPKRLNANNSKFQVGYVGHLYKGKGVELILNLAVVCPWADFHIVGGTSENISRLKKNIDLSNIKFHGYQPPYLIGAYIKAFDVVLLPNQKNVASYGDHGDIGKWTSPLKMFEYMAAAKPIIASDLTVLREVLIPERNALLASPENVDEWASCLVRLKNDPMLRKRLGNEALKNFLSNYTWKARAVKIIEE